MYVAQAAHGALIALRMLTPEATPAAVRARALREARALAALEHPGIARVLGTGEQNGVGWIALDMAQGIDLGQLVSDRGALAPVLAVKYSIQIAEALAAAHDAGVVHRGIHPNNAVLASDGRIVLVDFAFVDAESDVAASDLASAYFAPEQIEHGRADERSDIWALGCTLFALLVGGPPFGKGGPTTTTAILRGEPSFPSTIPSAVRHAVSACLRKSAFARIASPREFAGMLRESLDGMRESPEVPERASLTRVATGRPAATTARPSRPSVQPSAAGSPGTARLSSRPPASAGRGLLPAAASPWAAPQVAGPSSASRLALSRGRVKGTAVRAIVRWFADTYGTAAMCRVGELASPELRAFLRPDDPTSGIMASGWYDTMLVGEVLDVFERVASPSDPSDFSDRVGEALARDNVYGVYRTLFRLVASPALMEANAQRVWQTYVDEGSLAVRLYGPAALEARVRGWSRHHPTVCRTMQPAMEHVLRAVGYRSVSVTRTRCVSRGDGLCEFDVRFGAPR